MSTAPRKTARHISSYKDWSPAEIAKLETLIKEGHTSKEVARMLDRTVGSVLGKAKVQGCPFKRRGRPAGTRNKKRLPSLAQAPKLNPSPKAMPTLPPSAPWEMRFARPWLEREADECAWPVAGEGSETLSCCAFVHTGAYCDGHRTRMYEARQPITKAQSVFGGRGGVR